MRDVLRKAREGNAKAQLNVALNCIWGSDGFSINKRQTRIWYKRSALNGNPEAMFNLGTMELNGEGGKTDLMQGIEWLKKAGNSKKKHIYSETAPQLLSEIYTRGYYGIEKNKKEADYWKEKSKKRKKLG
jgi:TPR repeat protein